MNKKNIIESFISEYRKNKDAIILLQKIFYILITTILIFSIFTILEQLIYLESDSRFKILILIISFTLSFLILAIAHFLFQLNGKMKNYSDKDIAKDIGRNNNS